jgi:hypothetical protein
MEFPCVFRAGSRDDLEELFNVINQLDRKNAGVIIKGDANKMYTGVVRTRKPNREFFSLIETPSGNYTSIAYKNVLQVWDFSVS